jgi:hypothetical protein
MKKLILLVIMLFLIALENRGQSRWIQQYLDNTNATVTDLNVAYDNGYLLSGWIIPNYPPYSWLIKTDVNGEVLWQKLIGGVNNSTLGMTKLSQNVAGEIYLCGSVMVDDDANPIIIKINSCGEKEWCRELITTSTIDFYYDGVCTLDDGYAALVFGAFTPSSYRTGILKFSSSGDLIWQQYYQSVDQSLFDATISDLIIAPDGGFLLTGNCTYLDPENPTIGWIHPYYIKTDSLGNFEWETIVHQSTGDIGGDAFMSLVNPSESCYYSCISHYYTSDTLYTTRPAMVKLDLQGNIMGVYDLVHGNYDLGKIMTFDFINDSLLVGSAGWGDEDGPYQSRVIIFDTLGHIADSTTIVDDYFLGFTKVTFDNKILIFKYNHEANDLDPTLYKLTQDLEQDTFYTRPFVYDSLCPYQIVSDTIVPDDCGVIVGIEEEDGMEAWGQGGVEAEVQGGMEIWPNPANQLINVRYSAANAGKDDNLKVYDVYGRTTPIPDATFHRGTEDCWLINVSTLSPGIYFVILTDRQIVKGSAKFIIVR